MKEPATQQYINRGASCRSSNSSNNRSSRRREPTVVLVNINAKTEQKTDTLPFIVCQVNEDTFAALTDLLRGISQLDHC